jgi:hypothetical protein
VTGEEASTLERELARGLPSGHALKGLPIKATARREDCDDVAYVLEEGTLCVVHLTWRVETDPRWPHCEFVTGLREDDAYE